MRPIEACPKCGAGVMQQDWEDEGYYFTVFTCGTQHRMNIGYIGRICLERQLENCLKETQTKEGA